MFPNSLYINVAIALPVYKTYLYEVPDKLAKNSEIGKRVLVSFGKRKVTGYILGYENEDKLADFKGKVLEVIEILDENPIFPENMTDFFKWTSNYYFYPIGEVIKNGLPKGINLYDNIYYSIAPNLLPQKIEEFNENEQKNSFKKEILKTLSDSKKGLTLKTLCRKLNKEIPPSFLKSMEKADFIIKSNRITGKSKRYKIQKYVKINSKLKPDIYSDTYNENDLPKSQKKIIDILKEKKDIAVSKLSKRVSSPYNALKSLEKNKIITIFNKKIYRDPFGDAIEPDTPHALNSEQKEIVGKITSSLNYGFKTWLLAGVTGSGKTEVYMHIAKKCIENKKEVLILIPEIALISNIEKRFRARFGERVAVLHSGLSSGERYDQWMRIINKNAQIVIGARSSIFAPLCNIGAIIVDEEHDTSYKQADSFGYNAKDLAVVRAKLCGCAAVLGSATPSIQSYHNVLTKKYEGVYLNERIEKRALPRVQIVDMREKKGLKGIGSLISHELRKEIKETLSSKKQALLFLNRRGFASFPMCALCGAPIRCKNCDISLTFHKKDNAYKCHLCGYLKPADSICPACGSKSIKKMGFGTEKIEKAVSDIFPQARIARMDKDTTSKKGSIVKILKTVQDGDIDILIGTQMIAKGHDFPNITLVGIICADISLNFPDFRASEHTFQVLAQVAGRAGRGDTPGRVILQTFNPDHFSIITAKKQSHKEFFEKETEFRKILDYPPFSRLIQIKIKGKSFEDTEKHADLLGDICKKIQKKDKTFLNLIQILGPVESPISRISSMFRWQLLIKGKTFSSLHNFTKKLFYNNQRLFNDKKIKVVIDVDPFFML
jgi:primosomal protein N' (replication factor Y) (superfamily II helicase)